MSSSGLSARLTTRKSSSACGFSKRQRSILSSPTTRNSNASTTCRASAPKQVRTQGASGDMHATVAGYRLISRCCRTRVSRWSVNDAQLEREHNMQGERTEAGENSGRKWRHARDGGWLSFDLKVLPDQSVSLVC